MAEMDQVKRGPVKDPGDYGLDPLRGLGQHTGFMGGVLIVVAIVVSLAMALTKVRRLGLWMIPTVLYVLGVLLVARSPAKP